MRTYPDTTYAGTISFSNASGRVFTRSFAVSAEHERGSLLHDEEAPKTHFELQKIPHELERIAAELATLQEVIRGIERRR